jgi:hypothetical protein
VSPEEYMSKYLKMTVDLADGALHEVAIDRYLNHGKIEHPVPDSDGRVMTARAKDAEAARSALRQAVTVYLHKLTAEERRRFLVHYKPLDLMALNRPFWGKGSPQEVCDVLWLASKCGLLTSATLSRYCNAHLGLDCNGFAANYWGMTQPMPENASTILFNARPRTKMGDIRNGDAIVEFVGRKTATAKDARHVAVVAGSPSASGSVLTFDRVQSAGLNGNIGLEIEYGKKWELKHETGDGQLYFPVVTGPTAGRRCYFAAGPPKKAVPR